MLSDVAWKPLETVAVMNKYQTCTSLLTIVNRVLEYLYSNTWMDTYTRAVFVEFTVYNANVNLFCIVTLILETTAIGETRESRLWLYVDSMHIFYFYLFIFLH